MQSPISYSGNSCLARVDNTQLKTKLAFQVVLKIFGINNWQTGINYYLKHLEEGLQGIGWHEGGGGGAIPADMCLLTPCITIPFSQHSDGHHLTGRYDLVMRATLKSYWTFPFSLSSLIYFSTSIFLFSVLTNSRGSHSMKCPSIPLQP